MTLSILNTLVNGNELSHEQLLQIKKTLGKIVDKGGVTLICTDRLITGYNCNKKRKLTK